MKTSETIKELATALSKAQSQRSMPELNKVNPFHKSRYADLPETIKCMRGAFASQGLCLYQSPMESADGKWVLATRVMHTSGEWIESTVPLLFNQDKGSAMQSLASAITYARRYALASLCNLAADDDDDGNSATPAKKEELKHTPVNQGFRSLNEVDAEVDRLVNDFGIVITSAGFIELKRQATDLKNKSSMSKEQITRLAAAINAAMERTETGV